MQLSDVLRDLFNRIGEHVHEAVEGLDRETLCRSPETRGNPIGWLVWHLTRVQDEHVAELLGEDQLWMMGDWPARFGVAADPHNNGYGHSAEEVATIRPESAQVLIDYYAAVAARTDGFLAKLTPDGLDRIVDERFDPPVTLGVRLISIADDDIQHAGQAAYARGLLRSG